MHKFPLIPLLTTLAFAAGVSASRATETENHILRVLPIQSTVVVDGKTDDWDLSGGIFACGDTEVLRDQYAIWVHAMYDAQNIYFLAHWIDPTPLDNDQSSKGGHGFAGDCLQVRFISGYKTEKECITWLTCWRDRDGISVVDRTSPSQRDSSRPGVRLPNVANAIEQGAQQAFHVDDNGKGYVQEVAIPWKLLTADGSAPPIGSEVRIAIEPNFTAGPYGRVSIKDIFREGVAVDRVFTFRAYDQWGTGVLEKDGHVTPAPVRLADGRQFAVKLDKGALTANWDGLIQKRELPGFKAIAFDMPFDGQVSLNIRDTSGAVARQLLTGHPFEKGHHEVKWDGLATPTFRTPAAPLEAGDYTWEAIAHPGLKVTLRGWVASSGQVPWANGPTTGWGGDHGVPVACATDGAQIFLGWNGAEAGKSVVACDLEGRVHWRIHNGLSEATQHLASDGGIVFTLSGGHGLSGRALVRLRGADGVFDNWQGHGSAELEIPELWEGRADAASLPLHADAMDVKDGKLYVAFADMSFVASDVTDWTGFSQKVAEGGPIGDRILQSLPEAKRKLFTAFVAGKKKPEQIFQSKQRDQRIDGDLLSGLKALLDATDLAPDTAKLAPAARAAVNRAVLEKHFGSALHTLRTNFIAVCDAPSGKPLKLVDVAAPRAIRVVNGTLVYVISGGTSVLAVNPQTGEAKTIIAGLQNAVSLATGSDGRIYVGVREPDHQVKIFTADGKPVGSIGRQGGRPRLGPWKPDGMVAIGDMVVDKTGRLWVTEGIRTPKRVSVWDIATGKLANEFFGATHYGASGGAISPIDPNVMVSEGCEWRIDPATGHPRCTGVFDGTDHTFAVFCTPANGRVYVAAVQQVEASTSEGRYTRLRPVRIFERVGEGDYRLRATVTTDNDFTTTRFWSDANDNQIEDEGETVSVPMAFEFAGSNGWSLNINAADFTLYGAGSARKSVHRIRPAGFTKCGAPRWETGALDPLPISVGARGASGMLPDAANQRLIVIEPDISFHCHDLASGRELWTYPNPFFQVHGSHKAPPAEPGLVRGAFGLIGTLRLPEFGTVWGINTNVGEWHLITGEGFYLSRLFEGDVMKQRFPEKAVPGADLTSAPSGGGGEDFGGSLTQGRDGRVYVQTGKTAAWNTEVTGFEGVKKIGSGSVTLTAADLALARVEHDRQLQAAKGTKLAEIKRATPSFSGTPGKDFQGVQPLMFAKQDDAAVKTWTACDDEALYLAWDVVDSTPWVNGAAEAAQMYVSGDTVDFQFGSDTAADPKRVEAVAGDFRVSIGNFQGQPTAVLYRKVSKEKKPKAFTSGVIAHYEMEFVAVLDAARIQAAARRDGKGYVVEAALPLAALGFKPAPDTKYRGDFGVTHGDAAGARTRLRTHWNNQETGLVDDAVFELKMTPRNWGEIVFRQ